MAETKVKSFKQRLVEAQLELKAPKGQMNRFGGYAYRSAEDILEAVKPINLKYGLLLEVKDEIIEVGGRIYVKAIATMTDIHSEEQISVQAFAREAETKKGMDDSQITGSASSYARKYALNGLYLIDDTKDADSNEQKEAIDGKDKKTNDNVKARGKNIQESMQPTEAEAKKEIAKLYKDLIAVAPDLTNERINEILKDQFKVDDLNKANKGQIIASLRQAIAAKRNEQRALAKAK